MDHEQLLKAFLGGQLEALDFGHREHVAVGWSLLESHSFDHAVHLFSIGARDLAERAGAGDKFHVTLTRALMHLIAADRLNAPANSCTEYLQSRPPVLKNALAALSPYYSHACLWSKESRSTWVPPDLGPLPARLFQQRMSKADIANHPD
ncbi:MAG: hypothetical protein HKO64_04970 [Xanthomonadales bacterium]|nr:hypothetical protein [Gammaproteobacteria bacterium]NNL94951.1 hypothetical protein [Xanthomonadales bacterium]